MFLSTPFSCWERGLRAFPGVPSRDRVWSEQLITSAFECPWVKAVTDIGKVFNNLSPLSPVHSGVTGVHTPLNSSSQNVRRSCSFRGCTLLGLPPRKSMESESKVPLEWPRQCSWGANRSQKVPRETPLQINTQISTQGTQLQILILHIQS